MVMEACCIMLDLQPRITIDPTNLKNKVADYWEVGKRILSDPNRFLETLIMYDQDQLVKISGNQTIKIGEVMVPYHAEFRFYMTTKLPNPHYPPEVSIKVSLLNFFVTMEGLTDQLLGIVVAMERPELSEMKHQLAAQSARMKVDLKDMEDRILFLMSTATGNILDDEELIDTLAASKATADDIHKKVLESEQTEAEIDTTREVYRTVAIHAAVLFFCISDLAMVDPMYQYSLAWYIALYQVLALNTHICPSEKLTPKFQNKGKNREN